MVERRGEDEIHLRLHRTEPRHAEERPSELNMNVTFTGELWQWRGPAPYYFVTVPVEAAQELKAISRVVTYGWGAIPVTVRIDETEWATSLFPKDGTYVVPIKDKVRRTTALEPGDMVTLQLEVRETALKRE
jgi:hypothetical protein